METAFTRLVGCRHPLQQAGMGQTAGPELAVAVARAGALGMLGQTMTDAASLGALLDDVSARAEGGAVGVNFLMPFLDRAAVEVAASRVRLVEFFYGDPDPALVGTVHQGGALAGWQVGCLSEAQAAADAGCDLVVVQGTEAGGHVRGTESLWPLLEGVLDATALPVVAAGGIGSARLVAAALAAGAAAVRVGTRFVASAEADAHGDYQRALMAAQGDDTVLTTTFSRGWPDAPHRVLTSCTQAAASHPEDQVGEILLAGGGVVPVPRLSPLSPTRHTTGDLAAMALYAGQSVGAVRAVQPAADIVAELMDGAASLLQAAWPGQPTRD